MDAWNGGRLELDEWREKSRAGGKASGAAEPMGTLSTRERHAFIQPDQQQADIDDCYFRMLKPAEIGAGMAFPASYVVLGNSREIVKQYGNAVTPPVQEVLVARCAASLN